MSLVKLTKDLKNFKWTNYDDIGDRKLQSFDRPLSPFSGFTNYNKIGNDQSPQSFDINGTVVTGNKIFDRPSQKALDTMESRFGITDKTKGRGPYRISDFMDGTNQGRGFLVGGSPSGFIKDVPFRYTNLILDGEIMPTPLSYTISSVNYIPQFTIDEQFGFSDNNKYISNLAETPPPLQSNLFRYLVDSKIINDFATRYVETGWPYNVFGYGSDIPGQNSLITVPGDSGQPFIQKPIGQRYTNINEILTFSQERYGEDYDRIDGWLKSSAGSRWIIKQNELQLLSPRVETRFWNQGSILQSLPITSHITRHFGRETYMDTADFGSLQPNFGEYIPPRVLPTTWLGKGLAKVEGWLQKADDIMDKLESDIGDALGVTGAHIEWPDKGGRLAYLTTKFLVGSERTLEPGKWWQKVYNWMAGENNQPFGRTPPVPTQVVFSQKGAYRAGSAAAKNFGEQGIKFESSNLTKENSQTGSPVWSTFTTGWTSEGNVSHLTLPYYRLVGKNQTSQILPYGVDQWYSLYLLRYGSILIDSWRFFDPDNEQIKKFVPTVADSNTNYIENNVFTLNKKSSQFEIDSKIPSDIIKQYTTLAYGQLGNKNYKYSDHDNSGRTPMSPSEFPLLSADATLAKPLADQRFKGRDLVDGIGQQGRSYIKPGSEEGEDSTKLIFKDEKWDDKETGAGLGLIKTGVLGKYKNDLTDKINMLPYGHDYDDVENPVDDFIKFKFKDVVNQKFIIFRAILSGITDTITPEWGDQRYLGRPDKVYIYQGTDRKIAFTFDIYPKTKQEFPVLLEKLNYMIGLCYPTYLNNKMLPPFIELTLGDMFVDTPGILENLTVTVEENSTWELDEGLQFPKYIKCACDFTYIGKYMPKTTGKHYELEWISEYSSTRRADAKEDNFNMTKLFEVLEKDPETTPAAEGQ